MRISLLLFTLALAVFSSSLVRATDCGDGGDGSVDHCCYDNEGVCETVCEVGYGLSDDRSACFKCTASNCIYCQGDPNTCVQRKEAPVKNCNVVYDGGQCIECDDGYNLVEGKKDAQHKYWGIQQCVKCQAKNCSQCVNGSSTKCQSCKYGYGMQKGVCTKCKQPNCLLCSDDASQCVSCKDGFGLVKQGKGKKAQTVCKACPKGCTFCDGNNKKCKDQV